MRQIDGVRYGAWPQAGTSIRLRTLTVLRWMAIIGQVAAITVADRIFDLTLPLGLCYLAVGASIIANLLAISIFPASKRLSEREALVILLFDLGQLCTLLFFTGGITNPFAFLVLVPVTISASILSLNATLTLGAVAIMLTTLVGLYHIPIRMEGGMVLNVPPLFGFGFWLAILVGIIFLGVYSRRVSTETRAMSDALLAAQMALAREQKLTDLGGVVAAAAHELGTPLATITLVSAELMTELKGQPALYEDAQLIREQADRCRDILRDMGRAGKDDLQLHQAPLEEILREAAEPHLQRGKEVIFTLKPRDEQSGRQPILRRSPEIIHGLRNFIQNGVDFAHSTVWVDAEWSDCQITIKITDDGPGYPNHVIARIGDPFVRARKPDGQKEQRPGYEGMGLGLFIAKTLLERTGAQMVFANAADPFLSESERPDRCGAVVQLVWANKDIVAPKDLTGAQNMRF